MEKHTVEVTFQGEKISTTSSGYADMTLYRRPDDTYLVYLDARKAGDEAVLEVGHDPHGLSEHDVRVMFPELVEAQAGQ
jgi:hypothetical protein